MHVIAEEKKVSLYLSSEIRHDPTPPHSLKLY